MNPLSGISELAWAPVFYRDVSPNGDRRKVLPPQICAYVYSGGDQRCKVCGGTLNPIGFSGSVFFSRSWSSASLMTSICKATSLLNCDCSWLMSFWSCKISSTCAFGWSTLWESCSIFRSYESIEESACRIAMNARVTITLICTALGLRRTEASITAPCSVKAYGVAFLGLFSG